MTQHIVKIGDKVSFVWEVEVQTPLGKKVLETKTTFSYEEMLNKLSTKKNKSGKSRRSNTAGSRFSRVIALSFHAIKKGTWSTGAPISAPQVFDNLLTAFSNLEESEYPNLTERSKQILDLLIFDTNNELTHSQVEKGVNMCEKLKTNGSKSFNLSLRRA